MTTTYTINEVAEKFDLTAHTLRYYDKEGLLPFVSRSKSGNRVFTDADLDWVKLICCLKDTGMPIREIKQYCDWCTRGRSTVGARQSMLAEHRKQVERQIAELRTYLKQIDEKIAFYDDPAMLEMMDRQVERFCRNGGATAAPVEF